MLEMRPACERCQRPLAPDADARICSYECTFCPDCTATMASRCPNCNGELVARPRRVAAPDGAARTIAPATEGAQ